MEVTYAETAWHVFSAFAVFLIGIAAVLKHPFRAISAKLSIALYLWHSFFCLYYARFALYNSADARGYFVRSFYPEPTFRLGTKAVDAITSVFTQFIGLSYLGTFLVYNVIGTIGLLAFTAALRETLGGKSRRVRLYASILSFLPGISFWSVAIGKDAPALLGTGLLIWALLDLRRRWVLVLLSIAIYAIVRPHIVAIICCALVFSVVVSGRMGAVKKVVFLAVLSVPSVFAFQLGMASIGLGASEAYSDIGQFIEYRQSVNLDGGSSVDISSMILPQQMFYYAFMPLFVGAGGLLGLVASVENAFLLFIVSISAYSVWQRQSCLPPTAKWFYFFYALALWIIFAMTTANLGLALRQKWMLMPFLLIFCLSYLPERQRK
tara:strand:+ start:26548 stop:27684 length:1137 start_codon:yes stop_codon:yes gene_type:complete